MIPNTYTERGVLVVDPRPGPTPVSPVESGLGRCDTVRCSCRPDYRIESWLVPRLEECYKPSH